MLKLLRHICAAENCRTGVPARITRLEFIVMKMKYASELKKEKSPTELERHEMRV